MLSTGHYISPSTTAAVVIQLQRLALLRIDRCNRSAGHTLVFEHSPELPESSFLAPVI